MDMVAYFAEDYADLKAAFEACETRKEVGALARKITKELMGDAETTVKASFGALDAFKAVANKRTKVECVRTVSAAESRVQMADRYLSRGNRVGRLR